jgi:enoyl-CoA hydratase/carnithine racemase
MGETVLYEVAGGVATLTLDRPAARNAVDAATTAALHAAMGRFEADAGALVAILTGSGDRAFCAGVDLRAFGAGEGPAILEGPGGFAGFTHRPRTKPVVAAVNGAALGGGCELVLACDLAVAAEHALFGFPEVKRGLFATSGGALRLPRLIPRAAALEMLLTGEPVDARTALGFGLVNRVVPAARVLETARSLALAIAANAPLAVRETLALARAVFALPEAQLQARNNEAWTRVAASEDAREGPRAFAEKRPAVWKGR